ncbi:hypothetical protein UWK_02654 [Desulfocapsa sulfexigens DSM 10523]|uniref:Uncharacterized protein n=1 Tax=Desulfocapsa sulfexigens (strain DSM 10523 / SB164P1) TaxID=1167006 RepID=M1PHW3_DESSD|nr:hypothetical protein [Desulfocapsa sulfexigens]AGF79190.1 hypothetical protein UWK_02654 [Desulfocapsa sulfexigens DSM 10523]
MAGKLSKLKPGASRSVHLLVAATLWTVVGISLMSRGIVWLNGLGQLWIVLPGLLLGSLKSLFMLDRSAIKSINRIIATRDGRCIGGVYSVKTWLLVLLMMAAGCLMRNSSLPKELLGLFYVSIGWGLLFSSRTAWVAWKKGDEVPLKKNTGMGV